jgi:hypothetical protein
MRRAQEVEALLARRQRHRAFDDGSRALGRINDFEGRLIDQPVIERLQADTNFLRFNSHKASRRKVQTYFASIKF